MRTIKVLTIFVLFSLILSGCAGAVTPAPATSGGSAAQPAASGGELKIAVLAPLTGSQPTFGVMTRDGALLAIEDYAKAHNGGPLGKTVRPIIEDSQCSPDPAVNAANKVIDQDGVKFIVGEVCSSASIPVSEIANAKKVLQISPTSTNPSVTVGTDGKTKDYIFRACFIDPFQGTVGANFDLNNLKAKKAFILLDQSNDYVKGLAEFFEEAFVKGGGEVVGKETYNGKTDTDFSAILSKVAASNPDMVYLPDYYQTVNLAMKQAKDKGINVPFVGGDGWDSSDLDLVAADGGFFTNHYSPEDPREKVQSFVSGFKAKYNATPDALAALAYDATSLLLAAIDKAGSDDPTVVKDAMASMDQEFVSGRITFDAQHNPVKAATILEVTKDGVKFNSVVNP
jgi:branched-chain amino acid transport system substrate-binding protein